MCAHACVFGVLMFTWGRQLQPQEHSYQVIPAYMMFYSYKATVATRAVLTSPVCDISTFTWVRLQSSQAQHLPEAFVTFQCLPG